MGYKLKRIKEKLKSIWYIIKGGQYAVYVINDGYRSAIETPKKSACLVSDNASSLFLDSIVRFTNTLKSDRDYSVLEDIPVMCSVDDKIRILSCCSPDDDIQYLLQPFIIKQEDGWRGGFYNNKSGHVSVLTNIMDYPDDIAEAMNKWINENNSDRIIIYRYDDKFYKV